MKPTAGNILIIRDTAKETIGDWSVPEDSIQKPRKGTVSAISEPSQFQINDVVYFRNNCGTEVEIEGVEYLLLKETDIFLTV